MEYQITWSILFDEACDLFQRSSSRILNNPRVGLFEPIKHKTNILFRDLKKHFLSMSDALARTYSIHVSLHSTEWDPNNRRGWLVY